jgi:hypothetical protein
MLLKISVIQKPVTKYIITVIVEPVKAFSKSFLTVLALAAIIAAGRETHVGRY